MKMVPYASIVGNLLYAMLYIRLDICYVVAIVSRYQSNFEPNYWIKVKHILKVLQKKEKEKGLCLSSKEMS